VVWRVVAVLWFMPLVCAVSGLGCCELVGRLVVAACCVCAVSGGVLHGWSASMFCAAAALTVCR